MRNFSEASERNKEPILAVLRQWLRDSRRVLEVGSGAGQHALCFGRALSHLRWQPTEVAERVADLQYNLQHCSEYTGHECAPANVEAGLVLNVSMPDWGDAKADVVYTANTLHIIGPDEVEDFFRGVGQVLEPGGLLLIYGPLRYAGEYTSDSNAAFDQWLRARDPRSGIREFGRLSELAGNQDLVLAEDVSMPANNQLLIWRRLRR